MALTALAMQLTSQCRISGVRKLPQGTGTSDSIPGPEGSGSVQDTQILDYGTGSGQADIACVGAWTLAASGTLTWDIFTGTDFKDVFGDTAAFRTLKAVCFAIVADGDASGVWVGGSASNGNAMFFENQNDRWKIFPTGPAFAGGSAAGVTVDATHKNILLTNASSLVAVTVAVALLGTSV